MSHPFSSPGPSTSSAQASTPSPARLRAEARKQKILSQGNDRLAKITGAMKSSHLQQSRSELNLSTNGASNGATAEQIVAPEPPDIDISQLDSPFKPNPSISRMASSPGLATTSLQSLATKRSTKQLGPSVTPPSSSSAVINGQSVNNNSTTTQNLADPMVQMMRAMGLEMPAGGLPSDALFASPNASMTSNPMMQHAFASLGTGMQMGGEQELLPGQKTWADRLFPFVNLLVVVGLLLSAIFWWGPMSTYLSQFQGLGNQLDREIDLKAEWEALHPTGDSSRARRHTLRPAPVFWMFVTIELALQATRWMLNRTSPSPPGLLATLIYSLPRPYSTLAAAGMKYVIIVASLVDDLSVLVFGVGCAVVWLEWQNTPEMRLRDLVLPP